MKELISTSDLEEMSKNSFSAPQIIFKHSARCSISSMALNRMKPYLANQNFHLVDVIRQRTLSNRIAETFNTRHESPQVLIIHNGEKVFDTSHMGISGSVIEKTITRFKN